MSDLHYDFVVIGSGSSGGVIAARLSEGGRYTVLCLEAGVESCVWTKPPAGTAFLFENPKVNWCRFSDPNVSLGNRRLYVPGGKIVGGTSAINGVHFNRGQRMDYDGWERMGCHGWAFADVLPYFKKLESTDIGSDRDRGRTGPVKVTWAEKTSPFFDLFIESARTAGYPLNPDYTGETQYGVSMAQLTADRGLRQSTATQYLAPARKRKNLTLLARAEATVLLFEGTRCVGVRFRRDGAIHEARARREVIVSAGAFGSPKLLELSGIGNPQLLSRLGIPLVRALPAVGEHLRDHYGPQLRWAFKQRGLSLAGRGRGLGLLPELARYALWRKGIVSQTIGTMRVFARSSDEVEQADIALIVNPYFVEIVNRRRFISNEHGFYMVAQVQRPQSCGSVHIRSVDPFADAAIDFGFLATPQDRRIAVTAVRRAREIVAARPIADHVAEETSPGLQVRGDDEILDFVRTTGATTFHSVGTCRMGVGNGSVVDERLRVHGLQGLRVADASIMPMIVSGNTSIPCMMIGEKCADMILADHDERPVAAAVSSPAVRTPTEETTC